MTSASRPIPANQGEYLDEGTRTVFDLDNQGHLPKRRTQGINSGPVQSSHRNFDTLAGYVEHGSVRRPPTSYTY